MNFSDYYQSYKDYFWAWEEDAEVLVIPGGSTIAYREQAATMLTDLAEQGLPTFGAFLLAMIATNKTIDDSLALIRSKVNDIFNKEADVSYSYPEAIDVAFTFLRILEKVPGEYKTGKRRQILLQTIFKNAHNRLNPSTSKGIATGLKNNIKGRSRLSRQKAFDTRVFLKDFNVIALLFRTFPTVQSIIDAMGELPELEESDIPLLEDITVSDTSYEDFVEELMSNPKTFEAGALIKPIWAGFNIPIFNAHPSEQPLGGVSDLSNKGDFDKLLVSEFANDDLIFMNRIANNEALYLHREMPPVKDKLHRTILIDISLKNWGTPKILAYASYIAIARHPKALTESRAFVVGNDCTPVSCNDTGAIIDGLQKVDAGLHAGKGLAAFLEANKHDKQLEIFYITTAAALQYPEVQLQLATYSSFFKYLITTDAEGEINFYRKKNNAQKHLQTIRLPLHKLWAKKLPQRETPVVTLAPNDLPPLLLPTPFGIKKVLPLDEEVYCVANHCLMRRSKLHNVKTGKGWQMLLRNIPVNALYEIGKQESGEIFFLIFNLQNKELSITNLDTLQTAKALFKEWKGKHFKEFLFNKYGKFMHLVGNPDAFVFIPDFTTGIITKEKAHLTSNIFGLDYPARQKEVNDFPGTYSNSNILRNIEDVFINGENYLVINGRQLQIMHGEQLYFTPHNVNQNRSKQSVRKNKRQFEFADGSTITIDPSGYFMLTSSNNKIPQIFFSSLLDNPLGMATQDSFAGNEFFNDETRGQVSASLTRRGDNPIGAIKIMKNYTGIGLAAAKHIVDSERRLITKNIAPADAKKMAEELQQLGCSVIIGKPQHPQQAILSATAFYQENIATFIGHIINYAAAD
ncbi:ribosomal protein L7/L12 [Ferruginibacter sp. SUN106]|uniref:ribosomal protein L7/L12 n=1 Tax=Ferruginibacter sp. SUN106 TaxID=2978348 RepID=UPI003D369F01